jgi:hypothetical protein
MLQPDNATGESAGRINPVTCFTVEERVALLEFDSPPVNALSAQVREGLSEGLARAQSTAGVEAEVKLGLLPGGGGRVSTSRCAHCSNEWQPRAGASRTRRSRYRQIRRQGG